jgi:hypothetical protein
LNSVDVFEALDRLFRQAKVFWEVYDSRTVIVAPDSIRGDIEMQVIESVDLNSLTATSKASDIATAVRSRVPLKVMAEIPENALTFRDSAEKVAAAEQTILAMHDPSGGGAPGVAGGVATDFAGNLYAVEEGTLTRTVAEAHTGLRPKAPGTMNLCLEGNSREVFQNIAARFGFQVIFHRQFVNGPAMALNIDEVDAVAALDLAAFQSGNFWQVLAPGVIVVALDNLIARNEVEPVFLQTVALNGRGPDAISKALSGLDTLIGGGWTEATKPPSPPKEMIEAYEKTVGAAPGTLDLTVINGRVVIRKALPPRTAVLDPVTASDGEVFVASVLANGLVIRGSADKIARDRAVIALLDRQIGAVPSRNPSFRLGGGTNFNNLADIEAIQKSRSQLKLKSTEPISLEIKEMPRRAFEILAERAGLQVVFHPQVINAPAFPFLVEETDMLTALDRLSLQTQHFWQVFGPHSILVGPDNPTVRRGVEPTVVKVIYLKNVRSVEEGAQLRTALGALTMGYVTSVKLVLNPTTNTLVMRDIPERVSLIEKLVAVLDGGSVSASDGFQSGVFSLPGSPEARRASLQSQAQLTSMVPGTINLNETPRRSFEVVAALAGVNVIFHTRFPAVTGGDQRFVFSGGDFIEALDVLAFRTLSFWRVTGDKIIQVAPDDPTIRRELEPVVTETVALKNAKSLEAVNEIVTTLKTVMSMNNVYEPDTSDLSNPYKIRMSAPAETLALAAKLVTALDVPGRSSGDR